MAKGELDLNALVQLAALLPKLKQLQELQKQLSGLEGLAGLLGATAPAAQAEPKARKPRAARTKPEPRVVSPELAVAAAKLLLTADGKPQAGVFRCTYKNGSGYDSVKHFRVVETWTSNAAGKHPGVRVALCDDKGVALGTADSVGDGTRKLILGAMRDVVRIDQPAPVAAPAVQPQAAA